MFITKKYSPGSQFEKLKARLVAILTRTGIFYVDENAVGFLKTRVSDVDDWKKLLRLLAYLNGTLTLN